MIGDKERKEKVKNQMICENCGGDSFRVYITVIIDDARLYCSICGCEDFVPATVQKMISINDIGKKKKK